jgi:hypothetical protein
MPDQSRPIRTVETARYLLPIQIRPSTTDLRRWATAPTPRGLATTIRAARRRSSNSRPRKTLRTFLVAVIGSAAGAGVAGPWTQSGRVAATASPPALSPSCSPSVSSAPCRALLASSIRSKLVGGPPESDWSEWNGLCCRSGIIFNATGSAHELDQQCCGKVACGWLDSSDAKSLSFVRSKAPDHDRNSTAQGP